MKQEILEFLNIGIGLLKSIEEQIEKTKIELEEVKRRGELEKTGTIQQVEKLLIKFIKDSKKFEESFFNQKKTKFSEENPPSKAKKESDLVEHRRVKKNQKSKKFRAA